MAARSIRIFLFSLLIGFCLVFYVLLAGPYFPLNPIATPEIEHAVRAAPDLDQYLQQSEKRVAGVKSDLTKLIVWDPASSAGEEPHAATPLSIVYLHGFSASRSELSPVVERVAARLHANAFFTRLTAHGMQDGEAFGRVHAQDWVNDAREAMAIGRRLGHKIVLIGTSTGAALALHLAYENLHQSDIAAVVLISPNFRPSDWRSRFLSGPLGPTLARLALGDYYGFKPKNERHGYRWTTHYRAEGIAAMMDLVNYIDGLDLSRLHVPVLTLYTHQDQVVSLDLLRAKFAEIGSPVKRLVDVKDAEGHVLAGESLGPKATDGAVDEIASFVEDQTN